MTVGTIIRSRVVMWGVIAAVVMVVFTPLRAPLYELAFSRRVSDVNYAGHRFVVGEDSVRAIHECPGLLNLFACQYFVRIECDKRCFSAFVEDARLEEAAGIEIERVFAFRLVTAWPAALRTHQVVSSPRFDQVDRDGDGTRFASFYDDASSSMFLWVKAKW